MNLGGLGWSRVDPGELGWTLGGPRWTWGGLGWAWGGPGWAWGGPRWNRVDLGWALGGLGWTPGGQWPSLVLFGQHLSRYLDL